MVEFLIISAIVFGIGLGFLMVLRKKRARSKDDIYPMW